MDQEIVNTLGELERKLGELERTLRAMDRSEPENLDGGPAPAEAPVTPAATAGGGASAWGASESRLIDEAEQAPLPAHGDGGALAAEEPAPAPASRLAPPPPGALH